MGELVFLSGYFDDGLLIFLFSDHYSTTVFIFITGIEHALSTFHIWKRRASEFRTVESQSLFLRKVESQIQPLYAE